jgi:hypothetical protein
MMRTTYRLIVGLAIAGLLGACLGLANVPGVAASSAVQPLVAPAATTFVAVNPTRIVDSRDGSGLSGLAGRFRSSVARTFHVAGIGPIAASAVAITGNVTVTGQTSAGHVSITPTPQDNPTSSTMNFPLGVNLANNVTTPLSAIGTLSATYVGKAGTTTNLILDVTGYFVADDTGATFHPETARIIDSRVGIGQPYFGIDSGLPTKFKAGVPQEFTYAADENCLGAVPPCGPNPAITGNLTVTNQTAGGYLAITPARTTHPSTSVLDFPAGANRSNGVTIENGPGEPIWIVYIAPAGATADVILDMTGYYSPDLTGLHYYPVTPARLIDTRSDAPQSQLHGDFKASVPRQVTVGGPVANIGVPVDAAAVTGNLTITGQSKAGHVSITIDRESAPGTSTLNFPAVGNWANGVLVPLAPGGLGGGNAFWLVYKAASPSQTGVIFDVTGYFN